MAANDQEQVAGSEILYAAAGISPGETEILSKQKPISFDFKKVPPPGMQIVTSEEYLEWLLVNSFPGATYELRYRLLLPDGTIQTNRATASPTANRNYIFNDIPLVDGFLLSCMVLTNNAVRWGHCFTRVSIRHGREERRYNYIRLIADYVSFLYSPGWPWGRIAGPLDVPGAIRTIYGTDPAAGNAISETVPTNARWKLLGMIFKLVTDATAVNREVVLLFFDPNMNTLLHVFSKTPQPASSAYLYNIGEGLEQDVDFVGDRITIPIPENFVLREGYRIYVTARYLQAGDNFSPPTLHVEEWMDA